MRKRLAKKLYVKTLAQKYRDTTVARCLKRCYRAYNDDPWLALLAPKWLRKVDSK